MISLTALSLFLCVSAAVVLTNGLLIAAATLYTTRAINRHTRAQEANNEAVNQFIAMKREELQASLGRASRPGGPTLASALLRGIGAVPATPPSSEDKGPKGSA